MTADQARIDFEAAHDRIAKLEARLAAAERVISAARPISAMNNGLIRYSGPQMSELFDLLSAALDGYEKAYSSVPSALSSDLSAAGSNHSSAELSADDSAVDTSDLNFSQQPKEDK